MKKLLFFLTLCISINTSFGQNITFADSNAIWSVYNEKYFIDGDTIINETRYKKFYFTNESLARSGSLYALLRKDTLTQ